MIKIENGQVEFNGTGMQLFTEVGLVVRTMYQEKMINDEDLKTIVRLAKMTDEEIRKESLERKENIEKSIELLEDLINLLNKE